jgi:hypothetical protein
LATVALQASYLPGLWKWGNEGRLNLKEGVLGEMKDGRYTLQLPPAVFVDIVITGAAMAKARLRQAHTAIFERMFTLLI